LTVSSGQVTETYDLTELYDGFIGVGFGDIDTIRSDLPHRV